jgi:hypothetical protein
MTIRCRWVYIAIVHAASFAVSQEPSGTVRPEEAWRHIGKSEAVCGQVVDTSYAISVPSSPTYLFLERPRPEQVFTVVIPSAKRDLFGDSPEKSFRGKSLCATGKIEADSMDGAVDSKHRARVLIEDEEQITVR